MSSTVQDELRAAAVKRSDIKLHENDEYYNTKDVPVDLACEKVAALERELEEAVQLTAFYQGEDLGEPDTPDESEWKELAAISPNERSQEQRDRLIKLARLILENGHPPLLRQRIAALEQENAALKAPTEFSDRITAEIKRIRQSQDRSVSFARDEQIKLLREVGAAYGTEKTMHAAWEKRAYQAERENTVLKAQLGAGRLLYERRKQQVEQLRSALEALRGFITCESRSDEYFVKITYRELRTAQNAHKLLVHALAALSERPAIEDGDSFGCMGDGHEPDLTEQRARQNEALREIQTTLSERPAGDNLNE